jgi:hypothetical protein
MRSSRLFVAVLAAAVVLGLAGSASALTTYTNVNTGYWTFSGIQESSTYGDAEPLFDQPLAFGDDLGFLPPNFVAQSAGGGFDATGSHLQLFIEGNNPGQFIETLNFTEFGDIVLASIPPGGGTGATGTFLSLAGIVTVFEVNNAPIAPIEISFGPAGSSADLEIVFYSPGDTTGLPGDAGTTLWSAGFSMDIASIVPNATRVHLALDNDLFAASESNTSAKIQKKVVDGPSIIISVPGPAMLSLLVLGFLALGLRARRF